MQQDNDTQSSAEDDLDDITLLDPEGDAALRCVDQCRNVKMEFQVSSKVLRLASPVFSSMFSPSFCEGQRLLLEDHPVIELEGDDAELMGLIFSILHYQGSNKDYAMNAEKLARLSIHCDKYDLTRALGPWISAWLQNVERVENCAEEFGFLVLAAYLLNDSTEFSNITRTAFLRLTPLFSAEWEERELISILPTSIIDSITEYIQQILDELETELQAVEYSLRQSSKCYDTWQLFCIECGRTLPGGAKKCHPCRNTELPTKYCTSETRVAEYFTVLRKVELWPTVGPFATCSVSDISFRLTCARKDAKHVCAAGGCYPLVTGLESLSRKAEEVQKKVHGLCLQCVRSNNEVEKSNECTHK